MLTLKQIIVHWPHTGFCSIMFALVGDCVSKQNKTNQNKLDVVNTLDLPNTAINERKELRRTTYLFARTSIAIVESYALHGCTC